MTHGHIPRPPLLKCHYQRVLQRIANDHNLAHSHKPSHLVPATADWEMVVKHTHWYIGGSADQRPHYRYNRYAEVLEKYEPGGGPEAHVDLGCGADLFSWVFLDWATQNRLNPNSLALYGLDHSVAMLRLAQETRRHLLQHVPNYPELHYSVDVNALCNTLSVNHRPDTGYTITMGHVLVQAQSAADIQTYTRLISHVVSLLEPEGDCALVAVDAARQRNIFALGWSMLLESLTIAGVMHEEFPVPSSHINDNNRAKRVWLVRE